MNSHIHNDEAEEILKERIAKQMRDILKDNIPRAVMTGWNEAHRRLFVEFFKPALQPDGIVDWYNVDLPAMYAKIKKINDMTSKQYDEAEAEIRRNTYIPEQNLQILKGIFGDKYGEIMSLAKKEDEPADDKK